MSNDADHASGHPDPPQSTPDREATGIETPWDALTDHEPESAGADRSAAESWPETPVYSVAATQTRTVAPGMVFYPDMPPELAGEFDEAGFAPLNSRASSAPAPARPPRKPFAAWVITSLALALLVPFIWVVSNAAIAVFTEPGAVPQRDLAAVSAPAARIDVTALVDTATQEGPTPRRTSTGVAGSAPDAVLPAAGTEVVLAIRLGDAWVSEAMGEVDAQGRYEVAWTPWAGAHQMRVMDATGLWVSPVIEVVEFGAERDSGSPADYSLLGGRWNPCEPIEWGYAPDGGYPGAVDDVAASLARIAYATGLRFTFVGEVSPDDASAFRFGAGGDGDLVPVSAVDATMGTPGDGRADLVVRWATPQQVPELAGETLGIAGPLRSRLDDGGVDQYVAAAVILDSSEIGADADSAAGAVWTWPAVMTHEFAHAVGLGHATGANELMAPAARVGNNVIGPGDAAGLASLGAASGCLP